jgi:hypothetical protein
MRAPVRLCTLLGVLLTLLLTAVAHAEITPIPKPSGDSSGPAASNQGAVVVPLPKPAVQTPVPPARPRTPSRPRTTGLAHLRTAPPAPVRSSGGRAVPRSPLVTTGGHRLASLQGRLAEFLPTPLALAGIDESLPHSDAWPAWVLTMLTLLASAEAFLLVRLARTRRFARTAEQLAQLPDL